MNIQKVFNCICKSVFLRQTLSAIHHLWTSMPKPVAEPDEELPHYEIPSFFPKIHFVPVAEADEEPYIVMKEPPHYDVPRMI